MNKLFCDVLIFGAGIVGSSLALNLARSGIKVVIISDKHHPIISNNNSIPNIRVSAINYATMEFFKTIKIWQNIPDQFCVPYFSMKAWEWSSKMVTFHAKSIGLPKMGCVIENNRLQSALWRNIEDCKVIRLFCSYTLISLEYHDIFWICILNKHIIINSKLLVGADGTNSQIRKKLNIGVSRWKYNQHCMLLIIKTKQNTEGTIWQAFNPNGPIGFLPLYDNWGSLMWFGTPEYIRQLERLPQLVLIRKIESQFHRQLGKITLHKILSIPLVYQQANRYIALGGVLVGDAAHTIHPLAGQGINLGIRDVISLSKLLINSNIFNVNTSISEDMLQHYQNNRQLDVCTMQFSINCLYFLFNNNLFPLKITRNFSCMMINKFAFIKNRILQYAVLGK